MYQTELYHHCRHEAESERMHAREDEAARVAALNELTDLEAKLDAAEWQVAVHSGKPGLGFWQGRRDAVKRQVVDARKRAGI